MKAFKIQYLPFSYATRNLLRDIPRLLQKIGGSCVVVFLIFAAGAFNEGMKSVLRASGTANNVILVSAGSEESVERGEIDVQVESLAAAGIRGIESRLGQPAVSGEVHFMGELSTADGGQRQALLRGITPAAFEVHREARILEGDFPASGEVLAGRLAHHVLGVSAAAIRPGTEVEFEGQTFIVSGIFEAPGTVMESEVWFDRSDMMTLTQRDSLSCVIIRLEHPEDFPAADLFAKQRLDLELSAIREVDYYDKLSGFFAPIRAMTWLTAGLIAAGAIFGGFNLLYAAFASRIRELATLQAIGFRRTAVFISLVQESLLATLSGTLLAAFAAVFLLEGRTVHFSVGTFSLELSSTVISSGLIMGLLLGILGAVPPAIRCLAAPLPSTLRS
ncbi:MAG: putative ABC transport system permease protein [Lentimonas sp.]|jgi:putative ABC transport system permease protein